MSRDKEEKKRTIVEFSEVSFTYNKEPALENINLQIKERDFIGIIGPNGGGKTTLLKLILGFVVPDSGEVRIFNTSPKFSRHRVGYVPQYVNFNFDFPILVKEVVLTGRLHRSPLFGRYRTADHEAAREALLSMQIDDIADRSIGSLSGGQRQRVLIARALVSEPDLLLLDEPTSSVDIGAEENIYETLKRLSKKVSIVLVSHDVGFITSQVNKVACINRTLVCHPTSRLSEDILLEMYNSSVRVVHHHKKI